MEKTDYAYAVTAVRVRETRLLTAADLQRLTELNSVGAVTESLRARGWQIPAGSTDIASVLRTELIGTWNFLREIAPDISILYALILRKDYHNLKAAIKSSLAGIDIDTYFLSPGTVPQDLIRDAVKERDYSALPAPMRAAGEDAYDVLVRTGDGQLADIILDRAALNDILATARSSGNPLLIRLQELFCTAADIKTAFRASRMHKTAEFLERAVSSVGKPDREKLIEAAAAGETTLLTWLRQTEYAEGAGLLAKSPAAFEKWCDDRAVAMTEDVKYMFFGPEPLIAFYLAKEAEIKNLRILMTALENDLPFDQIRERMRRMYA